MPLLLTVSEINKGLIILSPNAQVTVNGQSVYTDNVVVDLAQSLDIRIPLWRYDVQYEDLTNIELIHLMNAPFPDDFADDVISPERSCAFAELEERGINPRPLLLDHTGWTFAATPLGNYNSAPERRK